MPPPSSVWSLLKSRTAPQRRQNPAAAASFDSTPTQQSLPYDDVEHPPGVGLPLYSHLFPHSDGACRTVHCSTANPGFANPKHSTSPRLLSVYNGQLYVGGVACYVAHMLFPSLR